MYYVPFQMKCYTCLVSLALLFSKLLLRLILSNRINHLLLTTLLKLKPAKDGFSDWSACRFSFYIERLPF
jgi:hypothetical protein